MALGFVGPKVEPECMPSTPRRFIAAWIRGAASVQSSAVTYRETRNAETHLEFLTDEGRDRLRVLLQTGSNGSRSSSASDGRTCISRRAC